MSQASAVLERWPPAGGALLGLLAVAEVAAGDGSPADLPAVLLLAVGTTVPLAIAGRYLPAAAATITAATVLTLASGHRRRPQDPQRDGRASGVTPGHGGDPAGARHPRGAGAHRP